MILWAEDLHDACKSIHVGYRILHPVGLTFIIAGSFIITNLSRLSRRTFGEGDGKKLTLGFAYTKLHRLTLINFDK